MPQCPGHVLEVLKTEGGFGDVTGEERKEVSRRERALEKASQRARESS